MISKSIAYRLILLLVAGVLLAACGGAPASPTTAPVVATQANAGPSAGQPTEAMPAYPNPPVSSPVEGAGYPAPGVQQSPIQVVKPDGQAVSLGSAELANAVATSVTAGGQSYQGIPLSTVVLLAGIQDYTQLVISGASNSVTLDKDKVTQDTLVSYSDQGLPQLVSGTLPADQWVKDITKIEVK
jgi:hypothetical protein